MSRTKVAAFTTIFTATVLSAACAAAAPQIKHRAGSYSLEVLVDGHRQKVYRHKGQSYLLGRLGRRYSLRIRNRSGRRVEAVVTVDGRDVLDGKPGNWRKRGYLIPAWGSVEIDGWRLSQAQVAAFRFSSVANSYASRTGSARNVGVIGVAVFPERRRPRPVYVPPPYSYEDGDDELGGRRRSSSGAEGAGADQAPRAKSPAAPSDSAAPAGESKASGARRSRHAARPHKRPGLGTSFGERRHSPVREVRFVRANSKRPARLLGMRYNNRRGLLAMGVDLHQHNRRREVTLRRTANPFPTEHGRYVEPPAGWR